MLALRRAPLRSAHRQRAVAPVLARQRALSSGPQAHQLSDIRRGPGTTQLSVRRLTPLERDRLKLSVGDVLHGFRVAQVRSTIVGVRLA